MHLAEKKYDPARNSPVSNRPVVTLDWDNTVLKNDAGDAFFYYLVANSLIKSPENWNQTSEYLTADAIKELNEKCRNEKSGTVLKTSENQSCADLILSIYDDKKLTSGKEAWAKSNNADRIEPAYAWVAQLTAGYKKKEIRKFAKAAMLFNSTHTKGAKQKIGSKEYTAWVRVYDQMIEMVSALQSMEFDVWVVTASPQLVVEAYSEIIGIPTDRIIGIRSTQNKGRATYGLEGCGGYENGNQSIITYRQGKRCWINKEIFQYTNKLWQMEKPSPIILAAGDSDTDVFFVKDAQVHLVINRNKTELMCNAYANQDGNWIINPMFIDPKKQKKPEAEGQPAYSCKKYNLPDVAIDTVF